EGSEPPAVAGGAVSSPRSSKDKRSAARPRPAQADAAQAASSSDQQARDAYREQLRRMAGGTSPARVPSASSKPPTVAASTASTTSSNQTAVPSTAQAQ